LAYDDLPSSSSENESLDTLSPAQRRAAAAGVDDEVYGSLDFPAEVEEDLKSSPTRPSARPAAPWLMILSAGAHPAVPGPTDEDDDEIPNEEDGRSDMEARPAADVSPRL